MRLLLMLLVLFATNVVSANDELPKAEELQSRLERLKSDPATNADAIGKLEKAIEALTQYQRWQSQTNALQQQVGNASQVKLERQQAIEKLTAAPPPSLSKKLTDQQLETLLDDAKSEGNRLGAEITSQTEQRQALLRSQQNLPQQIASAEQQLKELQQSNSGQQQEALAQQWYRQILFTEQQAKLELLQLEQRTILARLDLSKLYLQLLELQQRRNEQQTKLVSERLLQVNQLSGQQLIARAQALSDGLEDPNGVYLSDKKRVIELASQFEQLGIETVKAQQERLRLQQIRQQTSHTLAQLKEHIDWLQQSPEFSDAIRNQLKRLPLIDNYRDYQSELATAHLNRFAINQLQNDLANAPQDSNEAASELMQFQKQLVTELLSEYDQFIGVLTELRGLQKQVILEVAEEKDFLREKQLLLQGQAPLWQVLPQPLTELLGNDSSRHRWQSIKTALAGHHPLLISWAMIILLSLGLYWWVSNVTNKWHLQHAKTVGNAKVDRFWRTLLLTLSISGASLLAILSLLSLFIYASLKAPYFASFDQYHLLIATMVQIYVWEWLIGACRQDGLFDEHFEFSDTGCGALRKLMIRYRPLFYPLTIGMLVVEAWAEEPESTALRLAFIGALCCLIAFYWQLLRTPSILSLINESQQTLFSKVLLLVIELALLCAIALTTAGYFYAAWAIAYYLHAGLFVVLVVLLFRQLGFRWLRVEQNRLAYQHAMQRRAQQQGEENPELEELAPMTTVAQLSQQSLMVLNLLSLILLFVLGSTLLANTELALQWMDNIVVWEVISGTGSSAVVEEITLRAAINALVLVSICFFAAANLPGVLELLVLHHLPMNKGVSYAITTLLRYALVMFALIVGLSALGLHWSNLQWLIAALGVGLGFGLQEIFANLVCGLILLVERPVRVGDTITINGLTGTVTRINTRATTIQDWDKKEILVPNKALITDQLINWSLSDGITRLVIPIGVAYGSDVPLVKSLLLGIANDHPAVMSEPGPLSLFASFGDSALLFELRCYIEQPDGLATIRDELNSHIDELFRANNIEIAFPQLDVNIKNS